MDEDERVFQDFFPRKIGGRNFRGFCRLNLRQSNGRQGLFGNGILKTPHHLFIGLNSLFPPPHALIKRTHLVGGFSAVGLILPEVFQDLMISEHGQGILLRKARGQYSGQFHLGPGIFFGGNLSTQGEGPEVPGAVPV